ncbi:hypothetical protein CLAFUW4_04437 [Fulvia fulva]|uniref:Mediator of RNA polymerase II transcription subunit 1 n=1 Tax=Passalora fulva TaxID=5499 RepID=A0A9Q8P7Q1_PASFU|nr:uncharacterized protein CLAFUR5_04401 [Fulvia fulva]KAK4627244.1 hypothetical protein CLAFUR4_04423 [Fulvia fulva]KAK4627706.1 hypothetical protein CLAFUR0_04426 [Fulvia fulva]UJO16395.1 hypothetical protein CLAFUR5_04401 [Fulvia fulva]WPV14151.1 hypothetical protein CLAFUW4_04437 [Fulvia fulva]WPV29087.1 hypothetical protein CLAFUW7_04428 [Fulvia fulva]
MSTPTPSTLQQPGSASKKAAGHVTTPSHMGLASPAPRSVPSPAATRKDQAGKTPTNHPTVSSQGSKTLYGTPMVPSLSQTGIGSSPGQGVSFGTPGALAGLGVDLGSATPGQLANMTPSLGGAAAMMPTMSELGFSATASKRNEDEERRAKMRKVLKSIGKTKGRVSEEAIARVARRVGFSDNISDHYAKEDAVKDPRIVGNRELFLAGSNARSSLAITLKDHVVQTVDASIFGTDGQPLQEMRETAGQLFLKDLSVPSGILLESNLDRFAANLDRLARIEKLSAGISCFEAINGLYRSLRKLNGLEQEQVRSKQQGKTSESEHSADVEVLRKRSGRPTMHEHGKFGLALEYWSTEIAREESAMDIDGAETTSDAAGSIYSLQIEAEGSSAAMYTPLRCSNDWLPEDLTLSDPGIGQGLPWLEPPATFVQQTSGTGHEDAMAIDGGQHLPDIRFVARLDPPLVVPYQTATNMLSHLGMAPPQVDFMLHYYALLLEIPAQTIYAGDGIEIEAEQNVLTMKGGEEAEVTHRYSLDVSKPDWGYKLEKLPFSHPRQLVELLPHLRQWAHVGELLRNAFGSNPTAPKPNGAAFANGGVHPAAANDTGLDDVPLDDIMATPKPLDEDETLSVDIGLTTSPQPTLSLTYSDPAVVGIRSITAQIQPNADVMVTIGDEDEAIVEDGTSSSQKAQKLAHGLSGCNDLGVWLEWVRSSP